MPANEVVSLLHIDGRVLAGEEFEEYCTDHGLCRRCAKTKTHRRVVKMFGRGRKWEPLTLYDDLTGEYTIYKGYCLQPRCYSLGQAKRLLGETGSGRRSAARLSVVSRLKGARRPSRRKPRSNPETGSVVSSMDDDMSIASDTSGMSNKSGASGMSVVSAISGLSGLAGYRRRRRSRKSSAASAASSVSSGLSSGDEDDDVDDDMTVDTTLTKDVNPAVADGEVNPIVIHRVEQLMRYDYFTILDLSKVSLRQEDVTAIVKGITEAKTLESIILDKCKLRDDDVEKIFEAIRVGGHRGVKKLSFRQNSVGNKGAQALASLLQVSASLEELDFSENAISSRGAGIILDALLEYPMCAVHTLNLSQNEIWDLDGSEFLRHTKTLKVLNLDGNFLHDEGVCAIAGAIAENKEGVIEKLFLGWNGVSDDGAIALAKMMEINRTLQVLGLAENDITNTGARAILSALSINNKVREVSGLYHNQIDRKFIIVAIKRLLQRTDEREPLPDAYDVSHDRSHTQPEESLAAKGDDDGSDSSNNWVTQLYSDTSLEERPRVALEAMEQWDWGTFGIDEIEDSFRSERFPPPSASQTNSRAGVAPPVVEIASGLVKRCRVALFRSAPLAYFDRHTAHHHGVPLLDFDFETKALAALFADKYALGADIELIHEIATEDRMKDYYSLDVGPILHFTGYGHPDCLALENGFGYLRALPADSLKNMIMSNNGVAKVVVVSAVHALNTAKIFLAAGVKHVVCCQRESVFRDEGALEFAKAFYSSLAQHNTLEEAFFRGVAAVKKSQPNALTRSAIDRFWLLPKKPPSSGYHKINVLFENPCTERPPVAAAGDTTMLPPLPGHFVGRELDMYEILESLRVDDVVRIGGTEGTGKVTVISAVCRYVLDRPASFGIDAVYWLPPPPEVYPDEETCYADLSQVVDLLIEAEDDVWEEDLYVECRARIMAALKDQRTCLVVDGRLFMTEAAGENLERFLSYLLNEVRVKVILITAREGSVRTRRSRSEETMISLGPLDLKSSALLFGNACPFVSPGGNPVAYTSQEFASVVVLPSARVERVELKKELSHRQQELYDRMGRGNPKLIIENAKTISQLDLNELLCVAQRPELQVNSAADLEAQLSKFTAQQETAIKGKNFARARDLAITLEELELLRSKYPSLDSLADREKDLKNDYLKLLNARRYDEASKVKRQLLALKKDMLKEKFSKPVGAAAAPTSKKLRELEAKMSEIKAAASRLKTDDVGTSDASFLVARSDGGVCNISISRGTVLNYHPTDGMCGIVCWTSESCDLAAYPLGQELLEAAGSNLAEDIEDLEIVVETEWGPAKLAMGGAEILGPSSYTRLSARYVILAVAPLSPSNDDSEFDKTTDEDTLHYFETMLRTSYRSSLRLIKKSGMDAVGIPTITTIEGGKMYQKTLQIGLETLFEEAKSSKLRSIHLLASSEEEARILIKLALANGQVRQ